MATELRSYDNCGYTPGRGFAVRLLWYAVNAVAFDSWLLPASAPKRFLLRIFGARVGRRVVLKPRVNIKYPWHLQVGDDVWIGEGAWIDNLDDVVVGSNACISQGAYLLTGNHDYRDRRFGLMVGSIRVGQGVWIAARAIVGPGVTMGPESVLLAGGVLLSDAEPNGVYGGNPAKWIRKRWPENTKDSSS